METAAIFQVDAFADRLFAGNPAAVCLLPRWLPDPVLQAIAAENNVSETSFVVLDEQPLRLRWFTPKIEVPLCGHGTLAAAFVLFGMHQPTPNDLKELAFETLSGTLTARREQDQILLSFPALVPRKGPVPPEVAEGLGIEPDELWVVREGPKSGNYLAVFGNEAQVHDLTPDLAKLSEVALHGVIATAPGEAYDCVSRYFAPGAGIPEDPVTGSAHCALAPYWARRLEKSELVCYQASDRGGVVTCRLNKDRVQLGGTAQLFFEGQMRLPTA